MDYHQAYDAFRAYLTDRFARYAFLGYIGNRYFGG
jgi:hypothetical protein